MHLYLLPNFSTSLFMYWMIKNWDKIPMVCHGFRPLHESQDTGGENIWTCSFGVCFSLHMGFILRYIKRTFPSLTVKRTSSLLQKIILFQNHSKVGSKVWDVWHVRRNFGSYSMPLSSVSSVSFWVYFKGILRTRKKGHTRGCVASHDWHRKAPDSPFRAGSANGSGFSHSIVF